MASEHPSARPKLQSQYLLTEEAKVTILEALDSWRMRKQAGFRKEEKAEIPMQTH